MIFLRFQLFIWSLHFYNCKLLSKDQQSLTLSHAKMAHALHVSDCFSPNTSLNILVSRYKGTLSIPTHLHNIALKLGTFPFILSPPDRIHFV